MTTLPRSTRELFDRLRDETVQVDAEFAIAPSTVEEAAAALMTAGEEGIPTSFLGGGTHSGYGRPHSPGLVVTTTRLNQIVDWQPDDLTVIVQAGVPIAHLEAELNSRNQTAVLPESFPGSTVGGAVAVAASGYRRLRYGPTRDRVLQVQVATGYGKAVTGGSPVVKASTGYGVQRLATGSFGSLGLIGSVMLKLWSKPLSTMTVEVPDAAAALQKTYRPLAALESDEGSFLYLGGTPEQISAQADHVGGDSDAGLHWPDAIAESVRIEFRVPARHMDSSIDWARRLEARRWIAEHGVGRVVLGIDTVDPDATLAARAWAESVGGSLVVVGDGGRSIDPWGTPPTSIEIQRRIKAAFDPSHICNAGVLPGGI